MPEAAPELFPDPEEGSQEPRRGTGILPVQEIRALIRDKHIEATVEITEDQIQPASVDLRLASTAYRVRASFLPGPDLKVKEKIAALGMHEVDLTEGAVLERGCVYIVPLMESLRLSKRDSGVANPKSSTGRLDVFTRLITDHGAEFDRVRPGYEGPLYAEISPRTFSILARKGSRLNQLRLRRGAPTVGEAALKRLNEEVRLVHTDAGTESIAEGKVTLTVDLKGDADTEFIGYKARKHTDLIDIDKTNHYDAADFWEPIYARADRAIILDPDDFHILASREAITVPPDHAAEMVAYDTLVGEFRVHYAGFFDPGFGYEVEGAPGTRAVLEVRSHEVPFVIEHGQTMGRLVYERLTAVPDKIYGAGIGSSYQRQGLTLSKHFKR
ncbi:MAG: 2'-deoxycytidine 5'-triphosphate deaminase [Proteobacteria bacterium]|nr:2'-deoxycytidine 5'-triphosphate deaminase [Pseudomonadota bacterium]